MIRVWLIALVVWVPLGSVAEPYVISTAVDPGGFRLGGAARFDGTTLELTDDQPSQSGSAFWNCPIRLDEQAAFHLEMTFQIDGSEATAGADGLAFVIQAGPAGSGALGNSGGALAFGGVAPGVGIEFDTYKNTTDPNDNHIGIVAAGNPYVHRKVATSPVDLNSGQMVSATIDYNAATAQLTVAVGSGQVTPVLQTIEVLERLVGRVGYVGMVAATGAKKNRHRIVSWTMTVQGQVDTDGDGLLDDCDPDDDDDGIEDAQDNCPLEENPDQADEDGNKIGDACETESEDADEDGLTGAQERSAGTDPQNPDSDLDTISDGDEAPQGASVDTDNDGFVDARDSDSDGDGVLDEDEAGDADLATPPVDSDGDGTPDFRDTDSDNDGINDKLDRCRTVADPTQSDIDKDGYGDACDADADGDGILEDGDGSGFPGDRPCINQTARCDDNCPGVRNPPQTDSDADGIGDACDPDFEEEISLSERPPAPGSGNSDNERPATSAARAASGSSVAAGTSSFPSRVRSRVDGAGRDGSGMQSNDLALERLVGQGRGQETGPSGDGSKGAAGADDGHEPDPGDPLEHDGNNPSDRSSRDSVTSDENAAEDSQLLWILGLIALACVGVVGWALRR